MSKGKYQNRFSPQMEAIIVLARTLVSFYCQYADRHINLKFIRSASQKVDNASSVGKLRASISYIFFIWNI